MKQARDLTARVAVLAVAVTLFGCATENDVTAPNLDTGRRSHPDTLLNAPKAASSDGIASAPTTLTVKVAARRPPTVVRSDPSKGRTDVAATRLSVQGDRAVPANRISKGGVGQ